MGGMLVSAAAFVAINYDDPEVILLAFAFANAGVKLAGLQLADLDRASATR